MTFFVRARTINRVMIIIRIPFPAMEEYSPICSGAKELKYHIIPKIAAEMESKYINTVGFSRLIFCLMATTDNPIKVEK